MDELHGGYNRSTLYPPSVRLRMGEKELNFAIDDLLVSLLAICQRVCITVYATVCGLLVIYRCCLVIVLICTTIVSWG